MARKRKPPKEVDQLAKDVLGLLESGLLDRDAEYLQRGRSYEKLADDELIEKWCEAFNARADDPHSFDLRQLEDFLGSELRLREIQPPYDRVKVAFEKLIAAVSAHHKKLKEEDPQAYADINTELEKELDDFRTAKKNSN